MSAAAADRRPYILGAAHHLGRRRAQDAREQTKALGLMQPVPGSAMKFVGLPLSFDGARPAIRSRPPRLGEHTKQIFKTKE